MDWECPEMKRLKTRMDEPDIAWAVGQLDRAQKDVQRAQAEQRKFKKLLMQLYSMIGDEVWED